MANKLTTRIILRNDSTAGWSAVEDTVVLLKGEVGLEFVTTTELVDGEYQNIPTGKVKMKIGDGVSTWAELSYFGGDECNVTDIEVTKGAAHSEKLAEIESPNKGDIAINKEALIPADKISSSVAQKYQYTSYVYGETASGAAWKAMDGNYSADNVYFNEDFTFTTNIGTVTGVTSSRTVDAAGKSVKQFFSGLFAKEVHVTSATQPSVGCTLKNNGANLTADTYYEVGTSVSPSYTSTFEDGRYAYGAEPTGVAVTSWEVSSTAGESFTTQNGTCAAFVVADGTSYSVTAKATYGNGNYALSNIGNVGTYRIPASNKTGTTKKIIGYRKQFYGAQVTPIDLTSDKIRTLSGVRPDNTFTGKYGSGNGFKITIPEGCKQVVIALYGRTLKNVYDNAAFGTDIKSSFIEVSSTSAIAVEGANNHTPVNYNVYVYAPDAALGANTYDCIIG